jgi:phosphoenolpyruvate carboxykinase (GTP)
LPISDDLDTAGLDVSDDDLSTLLSVDTEGWRGAIPQIRNHYAQFGEHLPARLSLALDELEQKLSAS